MDSSPIKVAIVGGGLGGTILMNALSRYPQLDVQIYEAKAELEERGASVGLNVNAKRALRLLGMEDVVKRAGGVKVESFRLVVGQGPDAQKNIADMHKVELETVHRAALLKELTGPISKDRIHFSKQLESISENTLTFVDGSSATAHVIIGSDGIRSKVRKYILGEDDPNLDPVFAGFWDCRTILPAEKAREKIGSYRFDKETPRQHEYIGDKSMFLHDTIDNGNTACVIAAGPTPASWDKTSWKQKVTREWLNEVFRDWEGDFATDMLDLICGDENEVSCFVQWESGKASRLSKGNICVIGDAAHAATPWMGSGLGISIEDSLILQVVLGKCSTIDDIPAALKAYDQVMRPRGWSVIEASRVVGSICTGSHGLSAEKLSNDLPPRWDFILDWDTDGAVRDAVEVFEMMQAQNMRQLKRNSNDLCRKPKA